jgi:LemA protein
MQFISTVFTLLVLAAIAAAVLGLFSYNRLQRAAQEVKEKTSNVQVAVSKKLALLNQLVDVVRSFQEGEQFTHLKVAQDGGAAGLLSAYQQSGTLMATLQGVAERFPNLKASEQYHRLIDSIQHSELDIQHQRERYNGAVKAYNNLCLSVPTVFVAKGLGFPSAPYLEFDHSGVVDETRIKAFTTDDGQRLQQLLSGAGQSLAGTARALAGQATQATRLLADKARSASAANELEVFHMRQGGVPQGPVALSELRRMVGDGRLGTDTLVAVPGSNDWRPVEALWADQQQPV